MSNMSTLERIRTHTVRRLGHLRKQPLRRIVPTMGPAEVAHHASKELPEVQAKAAAMCYGNGPARQLRAVITTSGGCWQVIMTAVDGETRMQAILEHRDVKGRLSLFHFIGLNGPAHHYPIGIASKLLGAYGGSTTQERMCGFLQHYIDQVVTILPADLLGEGDGNTRYIVAMLGATPGIGIWNMSTGMVDYVEVEAAPQQMQSVWEQSHTLVGERV